MMEVVYGFSMTQVARATKGARDSRESHCPNSCLFELLFVLYNSQLQRNHLDLKQNWMIFLRRNLKVQLLNIIANKKFDGLGAKNFCHLKVF